MKRTDKKLPSGDYISGFVDGEGCFSLTFRKDIRHERRNKPVYYSWKASFVIVLRKDDNEVLEKISKVLNCGSISFTDDEIRYQVSNIDDLSEKITPFFIKHELMGKKKNDFILWCEAVDILRKYKSKRGEVNIEKGKRGFKKIVWEEKDINRLSEIKNKMSVYKSKGDNRNKWLQDCNRIGREVIG